MLIISLFLLILLAVPLLRIHFWISDHQIPPLLFFAVIGLFLYLTISTARYTVFKNCYNGNDNWFVHLWKISAEWIITLIPFLLYFSVILLIRNWSPSQKMFALTYQWTPFLIILIWFFHYHFLPLFWKWSYQTSPLNDLKIRPMLDQVLQENELILGDIHVIQLETDAPANALIKGLWPRLRIVFLSNVIIEQFEPKEIKSIFLHEVGHLKKHHVEKQYGVLLVFQFSLGLMSWIFGNRLNIEFQNLLFVDGLPFIVLFFDHWIVKNKLGCRQEKEADQFVVVTAPNPSDFITALKKIHTMNYQLENWKGSSHPDWDSRMRSIQKLIKMKDKGIT